MSKLLIVEGPSAGESFELRGAQAVIGRDNTCDLVLLDIKVSRRHARLEQRGADCFLEDLNSSNGTLHNGAPLGSTPVKLADGDELRIGQSLMRYVQSCANIEVFDDQETIVQKMDTGSCPVFDGLEREGGTGALRFLLDLAREAERADKPEALAQVLATGLEPAVKADRVLLLIGRDENMRPVEHRIPEHLRTIYALPPSKSIIRRVAQERVSVLSRTGEDERFCGSDSISKYKITSAICVPLLAGDDVLGAVYLDRLDRRDHFRTHDLELSAAAGLQCAMALLNIRRLEDLRASRDNLEAELNGGADGFVGSSKALRSVFEFISRVAPTDAGVLILGESGTGKELVARAMHRQSSRVDRPFVIVNCAALAESLAEAELFGHARGAFTGADTARPGRFLAADGGTIFLDEVGELPEPIQAKLLRVLESGEIAPVGEAGVRNIDVRVVAATNRDLAAEVARGRFRRDLYYRLNILRVELPPLRQRPEDIPLLMEHFVRFLGARCGRPNLQFSPELLKRAQSYPWPGNVRELKNAVERMVILCDGETLSERDLPPEIGGDARSMAQPADGGGWARPLAEVERAHIAAVLAALEGNKKRAAEVLGIDRSTLYAKLKAYDIS